MSDLHLKRPEEQPTQRLAYDRWAAHRKLHQNTPAGQFAASRRGRHRAADPVEQVTPLPVSAELPGEHTSVISTDGGVIRSERLHTAPEAPRPVGEDTSVIRYAEYAGPPSKVPMQPLPSRHPGAALDAAPLSLLDRAHARATAILATALRALRPKRSDA